MADVNAGLAETPIFVVGNVHSGTTMIQNILTRHPSIYSGRGESRFFYHLPIIRRKFPDLTDEQTLRNYITYLLKVVTVSYGKVNFDSTNGDTISLQELGIPTDAVNVLRQQVGATPKHSALFGLVANYVTGAAEKTRWLEKTPAHLFSIEQILRVIPDARFIELVRDPRAILASKKTRRTQAWLEQTTQRAHADLKGGYDPLWDTLGWRSAIQVGNAAHKKYPQQILRIQYENFVTAPEQETRRLCTFLGLEFDPNLLEIAWTNSTGNAAGKQQGIGAAAIDRWRTQLPVAAIGLCQWMAKQEMKALGYAPIALPVYAYVQMVPLLGRSGIELCQLLYRRWRLGGSAYLNNLFSNYGSRLRGLARS